MSNYNFSTLNDKEFERLVRDLLNKKFNMRLQSFKPGPDKGVDLRYSTPENNNSIVVQVKHYIASGFSKLKQKLEFEELTKIKLLKPKRYVVATSLPLSPQQKDEIQKILSPYILTGNDIFGQEDLNALLSEFKEIEKNHFKLWFSSTAILGSILHNAVEGRTRYLLENNMHKIPFYVVTKKFNEAVKILEKEKLLLITGQPGIGKTTLAEIILFDRAKNDFKIYKVENIGEAEDMISQDKEDKQLFYFDDFLGSNYFEIITNLKSEAQFSSFIDRIIKTPNKFLILTTRTIILNHAVEKFEKINQTKIASNKFEIELNDYDDYEKALILYNHLYFRGIKAELLNCISKDKFYNVIIKHKNYTPRIIEFVTDKHRTKDLAPDTYRDFIINNLDNPREIWRFSFQNQIGYLDKCLLLTLFSFENRVSESVLIEAFESRMMHEKNEHNQIIKVDQFYASIKILLDGFIKISINDLTPIVRGYDFINPSLVDFLIGYLNESFSERKSLVSSIVYLEQLLRFNPSKDVLPLEIEIQEIIKNKLLNNELKIYQAFGNKISNNKCQAMYLDTLYKYCNNVDIDMPVLNYIKKIDFSTDLGQVIDKIEYAIKKLHHLPQLNEFITNNFILLFENVMRYTSNYSSAELIPFYFKKYNLSYTNYINTDRGFQQIINVIQNILNGTESDFISSHSDRIEEIEEVESFYEELDEIKNSLVTILFPNMEVVYDFPNEIDRSFWEEKIEGEILEEEDWDWKWKTRYYQSPVQERSTNSTNDKENTIKNIEDLFSNLGKL